MSYKRDIIRPLLICAFCWFSLLVETNAYVQYIEGTDITHRNLSKKIFFFYSKYIYFTLNLVDENGLFPLGRYLLLV